MTTIEISKDITFTASEETIKEYTDIQNSMCILRNSMLSAMDERDWEDFDEYCVEMYYLNERLLNLGA